MSEIDGSGSASTGVETGTVSPASETTDTGGPTPSGPVTTSDIAARVIQEAEGRDDDAPGDATTEEPVESPPSPPEPARRLTAQEQEIEDLLNEYGFKDAREPNGRENRIPRSKVLKMIASGLKRGQDRWASERTGIEQTAGEMRGQLDQLRQAVSSDPQQFLQQLAQVDPRYGQFLGRSQGPSSAIANPPSAIADMPQPDVPLGDGSRTYSVEGLQSLIQWAVDAKMMPKVEERFRPYDEQRKQQQAERFEFQQRQQVQSQMQDAAAWPMFGALAADGSLTPMQQDVLNELQKDTQEARARGQRPQMTLRQAYLEVFSRQQTPEKVRERVLAELKTAPTVPSLTRTGAEATRKPGPRSTADITREILRQSEAG
jgi:hypothetical protein